LCFAGDAAATDGRIPARIGEQRTDAIFALRIERRLKDHVRGVAVVADRDDQRYVNAEAVEFLANRRIENRDRLLGAKWKIPAGLMSVDARNRADGRRWPRRRPDIAVRV
jgi:hypothetical protein